MNNEQLQLYCQFLNKRNYSESTIKNYFCSIIQFNKWNIESNNITKELLLQYIEVLKKSNKSYSCIKNSICALLLFSDLVLGQRIKNDFLNKVKRTSKLPSVISISEIKIIIESVNNLKHKTIISMIYSCGLRISECVNLKISDIDFSHMIIRIARTNKKKERFIHFSLKLLELLKEYLNYYKPQNHLFKGQIKDEYSAKSIQSVLKQALEKCNISKNITVSTLRHSFATHLVEQGIDIHIIREILGHNDIRSTQIYTHISSPNIINIKNPFD